MCSTLGLHQNAETPGDEGKLAGGASVERL